MPTTGMEDMDLGMALAMEATAMVVLAMVMAKGLLTLRLTHTMAMVDMVLDMALAIGDTAMVLVVLATVMARGRLMPSLTMLAKGLLTLRLMPTTAMVDMALDMALAMEAMAMEAMAMVVLATVMARGRLMPSLTFANTHPAMVLDFLILYPTTDKECQRL